MMIDDMLMIISEIMMKSYCTNSTLSPFISIQDNNQESSITQI
jgi:hypothetical protein